MNQNEPTESAVTIMCCLSKESGEANFPFVLISFKYLPSKRLKTDRIARGTELDAHNASLYIFDTRCRSSLFVVKAS